MAKRKKKNAVTLISLLLVMVVLVGVYVWYGNREHKESTTEDEKSISLGSIDKDKVKEVHYVGTDYTMDFTLQDGIWESTEEPDRPIEQGNVLGIIATLSDISAKKVIAESLDDPARFGLDHPKPSIELTLEDGKKVTIKVGIAAPTEDGYYALINNDNKVYLVDSSYATGLTYTNVSMTRIQKAPDIDPASLNYIKVEKRDGQDVELMMNEKGAKDNSGFNTNRWQFIKPYKDGYTANDTEVDKIRQNYATFSFKGCADYKGDDLKKYGLDQPVATVSVGYYVNAQTPTPTNGASGGIKSESMASKRFKIFIGNKADDDNYYVRVDGIKSVYLLPSSNVESMMNVEAFSLINSYASMPNIKNVDQILINSNNKTYKIEIKTDHTKNSDDDNETQTFLYQGKEVDGETVRALYRSLVSVMYEAPLKDKVDINKIKPKLTISFHMPDNNATVSTSLLPYNDSFDIIDKGTGIYFLMDTRKVDLIEKAITDFEAAVK